MKIDIINKSPHALPSYQTNGSAGMDLRAHLEKDIVLKPLERSIAVISLTTATRASSACEKPSLFQEEGSATSAGPSATSITLTPAVVRFAPNSGAESSGRRRRC